MTVPDHSIQDQRPPPPLHLRVFLASPGDVAEERALARRVIDGLPYDPLLRGLLTTAVVAWDQPGANVPMLATMTPQAAIAKGLPKPSECDIAVVIFWSRMGTPLPPEYRKADGTPYLSGTEWEYLEALDAAQRSGRPEILVYRRTEKCLLDPDDPQFADSVRQREHVKAFFAAFRNPDGSINRAHNEYEKPENFRQKLDHHLKSIIGPLLESRGAPAAGPPESAALPLWKGSPFLGLRAFTPDDAPIFVYEG